MQFTILALQKDLGEKIDKLGFFMRGNQSQSILVDACVNWSSSGRLCSQHSHLLNLTSIIIGFSSLLCL